MPNVLERRDAAQSAWQAMVQARLGSLPHGAQKDRADLKELAEIEVEAIRNGLARALSLRNATASPACRLPPEILAIIFSYLQAIWPTRLVRDEGVNPTDDSVGDGEPFYFTRAWYTVAHVCHLWREAAHTPDLWRTVSCTDLPPNFLPIVLSRTRGLSLALSVRSLPLGDNPSDMLRVMWRARLEESLEVWTTAAVLKRVTRLSFEDGFQPGDFAQCRFFLYQQMPKLKDLIVLAAPHSYVQGQLTLHYQPFGSDECPLPELRRLSLSNCFLLEPATRALLTSGITHLAIIRPPGGHYIIENFYTSIARMDRLEELTMVNYYPKEAEYHGSPDVLRLPSCLRAIRLSADFNESSPDMLNDALRFANRLVVPPTAYAQITLNDKDLGEDDEEDWDGEGGVENALLDDALAAFFAANESTDKAHELNISSSAYYVYDARTSPYVPPRSYPETCPGARSFSLDCLCHRCPGSRLLENMQHLSFSTIGSISLQLSSWIDLDDSPDHTWWKDLLPAIGVRRLSLEWSIWDVVGLWNAMSGSTASSDVLFPVLETIVIHEQGDSDDSNSKFSRAAGTLIDMLHTRKDRQVPVHDVFVDEKLRHWSIWSLVAEVTPVTFFIPENGE